MTTTRTQAFNAMKAALEEILLSHDRTCVGEACQLTGLDTARAALKLASTTDEEMAGEGGLK